MVWKISGLVADVVDQRQWLRIMRILSQSHSISTNFMRRHGFCFVMIDNKELRKNEPPWIFSQLALVVAARP
jgi:hypothetical protein